MWEVQDATDEAEMVEKFGESLNALGDDRWELSQISAGTIILKREK